MYVPEPMGQIGFRDYLSLHFMFLFYVKPEEAQSTPYDD